MAGIASGVRLKSSRLNRFPVSLAAIVLVFAMQSMGQASVVINEIHYNPPAPGGRDLEFVELYNSGPTALAIAGWKLEGLSLIHI